MFTRISNSIKTWNLKRHTRKELLKLSDRDLEDIGLSRGDIYEI